MTRCYLGLGSNLGTPKRRLKQAIHLLQKLPQSLIIKQSSIFLSKPCGVRAQPAYSNMVIAMNTSLSPRDLLWHCQQIELKCQRIRKKRWGARTIDIDILLYGDKITNQYDLKIPHPEMIHRDFVLVPLLEIAPKAQLPMGRPLMSFLDGCAPYLAK